MKVGTRAGTDILSVLFVLFRVYCRQKHRQERRWGEGGGMFSGRRSPRDGGMNKSDFQRSTDFKLSSQTRGSL